MITKVTKANALAYEKLFNDANIVLGITESDAGYITTLNQYYRQLALLAATLHDQDKDEDLKKFLRLPLDEPTFDIDANTRVITVPADFKKNGIAVKDDEIAEILYFTVDRYHDTMDFASPDINIAIQWDTAPAADAQKTVINGISAALFRDTISVNGEEKVIFGWAINKTITQNAGTIKFAVRFYKLGLPDANDQTPILYNLNTLVAQATVQAGITYDVTGAIYDDTAKIVTRLTAPGPVDDDDDNVNAPEFVEGFAAIPANSTAIEEDGEVVAYKADLDNGELILQGLATNGGEGTLLYTWLKTVGSEDTSIPGQLYFPAVDEEFSSEYNYYVKSEVDGHDVYTLYRDEPGEEDTPAGLHLYVKGTQLTATQIGTYKLNVKNYKASLGGYKEINSVKVIIPGPDGEFDTALTGAIETEGPFAVDTAYPTFLANEGATAIGVEISDATEGDVPEFTWRNITDDVAVEAESSAEVGANGKATSIVSIAAITENRAAYVKEFSVTIKMTRNGAESATKTFKFKVAAPAYAPVAVELNAANANVVDEQHPVTLSVRTVNLGGAYSEGLKYQWVRVSNNYVENTPVWNPADDDDIEDAGGVLEPGATIPAYSAKQAGYYYCKVANKVFGAFSDFFVPDSADGAIKLDPR